MPIKWSRKFANDTIRIVMIVGELSDISRLIGNQAIEINSFVSDIKDVDIDFSSLTVKSLAIRKQLAL